MADNPGYLEYPAIPHIEAAISSLAYVERCERTTGDDFGVGESVAKPLAHLRELVRRMKDGEL